jgi:hypothetical protein
MGHLTAALKEAYWALPKVATSGILTEEAKAVQMANVTVVRKENLVGWMGSHSVYLRGWKWEYLFR